MVGYSTDLGIGPDIGRCGKGNLIQGFVGLSALFGIKYDLLYSTYCGVKNLV